MSESQVNPQVIVSNDGVGKDVDGNDVVVKCIIDD